MQLVAGTHAGNHRHPGGQRPADDLQLGGHGVHRVHHIAGPLEGDLIGGIRHIKQGAGLDPAVRVDGPDALGGHLHLAAAHRVGEGDQLAVAVGLGNGVVVHQGQAAHACPGQGLGHVAAHTAHAEQNHVGGMQGVHALLAKQKGGAPFKGCDAHGSWFSFWGQNLRRGAE